MPVFIQFNGGENRPLFGYYIFIKSLIKIILFSKCNKALVCLSIPLSCWEIKGTGIEIEIYNLKLLSSKIFAITPKKKQKELI